MASIPNTLYPTIAVSFFTLGCKLNQAESEALAAAWSAQDFQVSAGLEDFVRPAQDLQLAIINTCTVTSKAEQKARRLIRKILRDVPQSILLVTGCYAQLNKADLLALEQECRSDTQEQQVPQRLFVVPGSQKNEIQKLPAALSSASQILDSTTLSLFISDFFSKHVQAACASLPPPMTEKPFFAPAHFTFHSRAFIKIQDGCDKRCAYCRVSLARGPSVSLEGARALETLQALEAADYQEAVVSGVNIVQYRDDSSGLDLAGLLAFLLRGTTHIRLRLSSLEPDTCSERLLEVLSEKRIQPHFHLSIQSGSQSVLQRMRRSYTPSDISRLCASLRTIKTDPFMACDIIAGFPGESPDDFELTYTLCKDIRFAFIHAFPFSPRPGTEAAAFTGRVSEREATERVKRLGALAKAGKRAYIERWLNKEQHVLIEAGNQGVSDNYLRLDLSGNPLPFPLVGSRVRCRILPLAEAQKSSLQSRFDARAVLDGV
ncbi:tRNA (N(6)-L-threonylcarbamoyladenosine(37)-C(2))-methylthiotransferase MtaB [Breznakiellaceae bacterium SP9]